MDRFLRLIERRRAALTLKAQDFYKRAGITERTFQKAKAERSMTEATFVKLLAAMELADDAEEVRWGVFRDKDVLTRRIIRSLPILIPATLAFVAVFVFAGVCALTDVCRPGAANNFDDEYARYQLQTGYFLRVTHNGRYTGESFLGPALTTPERPSIYFDSGPSLAGPVDVSIGIFDRATGDELQNFELEGNYSEYRQPYFDNRTVLRSVNIEILECIAYQDERLQRWVKQFRVFHPDAQRLDEQVMQEMYGDLNLIQVFVAEVERSSNPISCESDPREEDAYSDFLASGNGEALINFDPEGLQPRTLTDIGYALLGWQGHCITLNADGSTRSPIYERAYNIIFRDSAGEVVPRHGICFKGEDRFTVEFEPRDASAAPLRPIEIEGLFDQAVQRNLGMQINQPGGREGFISCSVDFCGLRDLALECHTLPPTIFVSIRRQEVFSVVLPNCADENPAPHFQCLGDGYNMADLEDVGNWEVMLRYHAGRTAFLGATPAGDREFPAELRIDFPC